jgi:hypothetical protein
MDKIRKQAGGLGRIFILTILFILSANPWRNVNPGNPCNLWSKFAFFAPSCGNSFSVHQRWNQRQFV